jgi:hemerythrin-like domain-containing protein
MRRDPRLRDLSSEHHQALVLARRASTAPEPQVPETWAEVRRRFDAELAPHFAIEERLMLPALDAAGEAALAARTRADHEALRALLTGDDDAVARLRAFGALLAEHVRFEERELFPTAEARLPADVLDAIAAAHE